MYVCMFVVCMWHVFVYMCMYMCAVWYVCGIYMCVGVCVRYVLWYMCMCGVFTAYGCTGCLWYVCVCTIEVCMVCVCSVCVCTCMSMCAFMHACDMTPACLHVFLSVLFSCKPASTGLCSACLSVNSVLSQESWKKSHVLGAPSL